MKELIIGSHVSFKSADQLVGSVKETISYGANTFMFYTGAPQNTNRAKIDDNLTMEAYKLMKEHNIALENVIVHAPYIINLANTEKLDSYNFAIDFLKQEIDRCESLGMTKLVLHPGSSVKLPKEIGIKNIIDALNKVLTKDQKVIILLETMAGKGSEIGSSFEEIKQIKNRQKFDKTPDEIYDQIEMLLGSQNIISDTLESKLQNKETIDEQIDDLFEEEKQEEPLLKVVEMIPAQTVQSEKTGGTSYGA